MVKLPDGPSLGPAPRADVVGADLSPIARGQAAINQGVQQLGEGINKLGAGVGDYALQQTRWQYAAAHSDFLANKTDLDQQLSKDTNYGPDETGKTLPQRYNDKLTEIQSTAGATIQDPAMRERFAIETKPQIAHGNAVATNHAIGLENNASVAFTEQQGMRLIDQAVNSADPELRRQAIDNHNLLVDGLQQKGAITATQALQMRQKWATDYAESDVRARLDRGDFSVIDELRGSRGTMPPTTGPRSSFDGVDPNSLSAAGGLKSDRAKYAMEFFVNSGKTPAQAAGIVGNLFQESARFNTREVHDGGIGLGIAGWNGNRLAALKQFAGAQGNSVTDYPTQLAFINHELETKEGVAASALEGAKNDPMRAGAAMVHYERPLGYTVGNPSTADGFRNRVNNARFLFEQHQAGDQGGSGGTQLAQADTGTKTDAGAQLPAPRPGGIYSLLDPDKREKLIEFGISQQHKQLVQSLGSFKQAIEDNQDEAFRTGDVKQEIPKSQFDLHLGENSDQAYLQYKANLQLGRDRQKVAELDPEEQQSLYEKYEPKPGEGFASQATRRDALGKAIVDSNKEKMDDPAGFAARRLPASRDAYSNLLTKLSDPQATDDDRKAAARSYVTASQMEQQRVGIPTDAQKVVPQGYIDRFNHTIAAAADSDDAQKRVGLIGQIQREAAMWGDSWPGVMRQLAPESQPVVRAIAAGADPTAMTRLLSLPKGESPAKVLKEQSETKFSELTKSLNEEMAPFRQTLVGRQVDRDFTPYYGLAEKLGALYVRDGKSASEAAAAAFKDIIGGRYEFRDTYRIPKSAGVSADDVQAGAQEARTIIAQSSTETGGNRFNLAPALNDMGLSDNRGDSFSKFARDGKFVTSPDNSGLNLAYGNKFVKTADGKPLLLTWSQLAQHGSTPEARARGTDADRMSSPQSP